MSAKSERKIRVWRALSHSFPGPTADDLTEYLNRAIEVYPKLKPITKAEVKEHLKALEEAGEIVGTGRGNDRTYKLAE